MAASRLYNTTNSHIFKLLAILIVGCTKIIAGRFLSFNPSWIENRPIIHHSPLLVHHLDSRLPSIFCTLSVRENMLCLPSMKCCQDPHFSSSSWLAYGFHRVLSGSDSNAYEIAINIGTYSIQILPHWQQEFAPVRKHVYSRFWTGWTVEDEISIWTYTFW